MDFGMTIRTLRKGQGFTQRKLAAELQRAGFRADMTYISKIETGKLPHGPSLDLIRALAAILQTDTEQLLDLAGKFDPKVLQERIAAMPEVGLLVRRLQSPTLTRRRLQQALRVLSLPDQHDKADEGTSALQE